MISPALKLRPTNSGLGSYSSRDMMERWLAFMMGWHIAAMRSRKSWAKVEVGPGRGFMNTMREFGDWWRALRRWMLRGIMV